MGVVVSYTGREGSVPTANFIPKWVRSEIGAHKFDENLAEVSLITKDVFELSLLLSVVVTSTTARGAAVRHVKRIEEVLIGTPSSPKGGRQFEEMLEQLRARQIAEEQVETYRQQEKAAGKERDLREAVARADRQKALTESELAIQIEANEGRASYERSVQAAAQMRTMSDAEAAKTRLHAEADADKVRMMGEAEAGKAARVGIAEAVAAEEQVRAYGGPRYQVTQQVMKSFADAIATAKVDVVPRVVVGGAQGPNGFGQGSVLETLLALMLSDKMSEGEAAHTQKSGSPQLEELRARLKRELSASSNGTAS